MALTNTTCEVRYTGTGATATYAIPFRFDAKSDLAVSTYTSASPGVKTDLVLTTDYTIPDTDVGLSAGGSLTLVAGNLASGTIIVVRRVKPLTQTTDIANQGAYYAKTHEDRFDAITEQIQELDARIDRSFKLTPQEAGTVALTELAGPASYRALKVLYFDASGNPTTVSAASIDLTVLAFSPGSVLFIGPTGAIIEDNANFNYAGSILTAPRVRTTDGTAALPAYSFTSETNSGMYRVGAAALGFSVNGTTRYSLSSGDIRLNSSVALTWASGDPSATAADLKLYRGGSNILSQSNATNAQTYRLYNTTDSDTSPTNYERMELYFLANTAYLEVISGGTGTTRNLVLGTRVGVGGNVYLQTTGSLRWLVEAGTGHLLAQSNNVYDIGASAANKPRSIYAGTSFLAADGAVGTPSYTFSSFNTAGLFATSANNVQLSLSGGSAFQWASTVVRMRNNIPFAWSTTSDASAGTAVQLLGTTAVISLVNTTTSQSFHVYKTSDSDTSPTNYERLVISGNPFSDGNLGIVLQKGGTGADRNFYVSNNTTGAIIFRTSNLNRWQMSSNGHWIADSDNSVDVGATGANRPRSLYWGTQALAPNGAATAGNVPYSFASATDAGMYRNADGSIHGVHAGNSLFCWYTQSFAMGSNIQLGWTTGSFAPNGTQDVFLSRVAVNAVGSLKMTVTGTLTGSPTDFNLHTITPTLAGAFTVTRLNYLDLNNVAGAATVTDASIFRFDAATGTHKALASNAAVAVTFTGVGPTGSQTTIQGWMKINVNGTLRYVPFW